MPTKGIDLVGTEVKPYRIDWRPDLTTGWVLMRQLDEHPGDLPVYLRAQGYLGIGSKGQWRVVSQHTIAAQFV